MKDAFHNLCKCTLATLRSSLQWLLIGVLRLQVHKSLHFLKSSLVAFQEWGLLMLLLVLLFILIVVLFVVRGRIVYVLQLTGHFGV